MSGDQLIAALPQGDDHRARHSRSSARSSCATATRSIPEAVTIDLDAAKRVAQSLIVGGLLKPDANISGLHDTSIVGG